MSLVRTERRGFVLLVEMHRAAKRNAVDRQLADELSDAFDEFERDAGLRAAVLTGSDGVFSAGTDLHETASPATPSGGEYGLVRRERSKPLLAAVEGIAYGGGFEIALACDIVIASRTASFALPEVKRGVVAACGGLFRTHRALPPGLANLLLLTGDPIDAEQAAASGLVTVVTEPGAAVDAALDIAARIAANSPTAVRTTLAGARRALSEHDAIGWRTTDEAVAINRTSPDAAEGVAAFFARRPPNWA